MQDLFLFNGQFGELEDNNMMESMSKEGDSCFPWKECSVTVQFKNRYVTFNTQFKAK